VQAFYVCVLLTNFAMLGLNASAMRFLNEQRPAGEREALARGFMGFATRWSLATAVLFAAIGAGVVGFVVEPADRPAYWLGLAAIPLYTFMRLQGQFAHALAWFGLWIVPNTVARPLALLLVVGIGFAAGWPMTAAWVMSIHLAVIAVVLLPQAVLFGRGIRRLLPPATPIVRRELWLRTAWPLLLVTTFSAFHAEVNVVLVGMVGGDVAIFNAAFKTAMFLGFLAAAMDGAILPGIARRLAAGELAAVQRSLDDATRIKVVFTTLGLVAIWLLAPWLMGVFGPEFRPGADVLVLLAASQLARAALGPAAEILGITGHQRLCVVVYAGGLLGTLAGHLLLIPWLGLYGAALTVLAVAIGTGWILARIVHRELGLHPGLRLPSRSPRPES
jgi:O-antigen/teichoic acid export membrane protein